MLLSPRRHCSAHVCRNVLRSLGCLGIITLCLAPFYAIAQDNIAPRIVGQQPLRVDAGTPLAITLADLEVVDPDNSYPNDFTLQLTGNSEAFQTSDNSVILSDQFEGSLDVTVIVNDGIANSDPFTLTVDVTSTTGKGGKGDESKGGGKNDGPGKDQSENKGPGKKDEGKKGEENKGPGKNQGDDKGGGKKDDEKKGGENAGPGKGQDENKGPGKKDDDKKGDENKGPGKNQGDNKGGGKNNDEKKGGENAGPGKDQDENKGPGKKDDDKKGDENKGPGKNQGDDKGGGKNDDEKNNEGNNSGSNGGGNNAGGNDGGQNNSGGNNAGNNPPPSNVAPIITGQHEIATGKNVTVVLDLNMLKVDDPDNTYPNDFSLQVFGGSNYTLEGKRLTPANNFTGTLDVRVRVNDGIANSNDYTLNILVKEGNIPPQIIGQAPLATDEETPLSIGFNDLIVFDPDSPYPDGFTINLSDGEHHKTNGRIVQPRENFSGPLTIMVTVNDGRLESDPYPLLINVNPVNDGPTLENIEQGVLPYVANAGPASVTERIQVADADGDNIVGAEISFDMETYQSGHDLLSYEPAGETPLPIESVFDPEKGTLFLIGGAPASDYQKALRSVAYSFSHENVKTVPASTKTLYFVVRDGDAESNVVTRKIAFSNEIALDVPQAFTPNGDMANDTWFVTPLQNAKEYSDAVTRVYTIRGELLYEASGFEWEWDGRYEGQYLPSGTYYYVIAIKSGVALSNRKGIVTILR